MREIKFRAWDKVNRQMFFSEFPNFKYEYATDWLEHIIMITGITVQERKIAEETDRFEVMQYIGVKDKNNIEIYESDIVRHYNEKDDGTIDESKFIDGIVKWDKTNLIIEQISECKDNDMKFYFYEEMFDWEELEVIGNIYEKRKKEDE